MATILIVDDEASIVEIVTEVLSNEGHQVVTAPDGLIGLEILHQGLIPQLILLDLFLPGINGCDFITKVRAELQLPDLPILLMTGAIPDQSDLPPKGSFQEIIHKPFNLVDLIDKVDQSLAAATEKMIS